MQSKMLFTYYITFCTTQSKYFKYIYKTFNSYNILVCNFFLAYWKSKNIKQNDACTIENKWINNKLFSIH